MPGVIGVVDGTHVALCGLKKEKELAMLTVRAFTLLTCKLWVKI